MVLMWKCRLQKKARGWTTPRSSKSLSPESADPIVASPASSVLSMYVSSVQHSRKALCPAWSDIIGEEIEESQSCALRQHSCKALSYCFNPIV
jgi:hypothetical protein